MVTGQPWSTWPQLVDELQHVCAAQRSGTLFGVTETEDSVFIVIRDGAIVALGFKALRGAAAIPLLQGVKRCRFNFKNKLVPWVQDNLPDTGAILRQFCGNLMPATPPPVAPPPTPPVVVPVAPPVVPHAAPLTYRGIPLTRDR